MNDDLPTRPESLTQQGENADLPPSSNSLEHWSDCAVNNAPALPVGPCDCGGWIASPLNDMKTYPISPATAMAKRKAKEIAEAGRTTCSENEHMVDWRKILIAYITHVGNAEGTDFLPGISDDFQNLTAAEIADLLKAGKEAEEAL
jgi:hypothetical protein